MKAGALLLTYRDSSHTLDHSLWSVERFAGIAPENTLIADDSSNPMPDDYVAGLEARGYRVTRTSFTRNRNLNGYECVMGVLGLFGDVFEVSGADYVLKIDPDTMLFSSEIVDRLGDGEVGSFGGEVSHRKGTFYGMSYVLRRDIAARALEFAAASSAEQLSALIGDRKLPEDYTISAICQSIAPSSHVVVPYRVGSGFHCSWPYGRKGLSPLQIITAFGSVHFGQWHRIEGRTPTQKRVFAGAVMGGCRSEIERLDGRQGKQPCVVMTMRGFGAAGDGASFTGGFNSTFVYDILPVQPGRAPLISVWVHEEMDSSNGQGVEVPGGEPVHVEVHVYRSAWVAQSLFGEAQPVWYSGGSCAILRYDTGSGPVSIPFYEAERGPGGDSTLRDSAGRIIKLEITEEKTWAAVEKE